MNGTARGGELEVRAGSLVNESVTFTLVIQAVRPAVGEGSTGIASAPNLIVKQKRRDATREHARR